MPPIKMLKPQAGPAHTSGIFADMTVDGPILGDLVVVVDRARNLPNRKTMGKQDPYCAARLGKEAKKTETDVRGGQTPRWDQELRFVVHESPDYLKLKLSIFNEDRRTELIGETWIDLKDVIVRGGGQNDGWHRLICKGKPSGEVRMEITFYDTREKPAEAPTPRSSRQSEQLHGGARDMPTRRPLPRGPGGIEPPAARAPVPHSASTSHIPSRLSHPPEGAMLRHMSTDATEQGPLDPHEHRRKMLAAHGLPFDPHAQKFDERLTHHGGPRPVPGQNFTDLDRLRYRNRGVAIPEGLVQEERQQRSHRNTYEAPVIPEPELEPAHTHVYEEAPVQDIHPSQLYQPQTHSQTYSQPQPQPSHPVQDDFRPESYHQRESRSYNHHDYTTHHEVDHTAYQQPYVEEEEDEGPPPPPPAHRSNVSSLNHVSAPLTHFEPEPPAPSLQHGLARLNAQNGDSFYVPMENSTQLTTHSDMPAPGHSDPYNHGHRPSPRASQVIQGYSPAHQRSMQDMRVAHTDDRYGQYSTPSHPQDRSVQRLSYDPRNEMLDDFRSSGPPAPIEQYGQNPAQMQLQRHSGYEAFSHREAENTSSTPRHIQHMHSESSFHQSPIDSFQEPQTHPSVAPLVKPRPVSPNINSPHYQAPPPQHSTSPYTPNHASSTNSNSSSIPRKSVEPRLSDIAFSPDSFDVLNPQVKSNRLSTSDPDGMLQSPYANGTSDPPSSSPAHDSNDPIRDSQGRLVDPSDHLPTHTWAPEPEPKKPLKAEVKLRFKGAVPMPTTAPRAPRPDVQMPAVKSSVFSPHLTEKPGDTVEGKGKDNRNRLQKKVRVMMTTGGRRERGSEAIEREVNNLASGTSQPLRDIPNVNYGSVGNAGGPTSLPAKVSSDIVGYEENMGIDALSREMNSIDLGAYGGRGNRRTRFATTIM